MDIVYVLGKGSLSNNDEIRYSLRSIEKYCSDIGNVIIVGDEVDFLKGVLFIKMEDTYNKPWKNVFDKVRAVCMEESVSDDFLLMNDDFFAFDSFIASEVPFYANKGGNGGASGTIDFATHKPIRINKELYLKMPMHTDMSSAMSPRSFYGNFYKAPPTFSKDIVLRTGAGLPSLDVQLANNSWATIDDVTMTDLEFRGWIDSRFEEKSSFEIYP